MIQGLIRVCTSFLLISQEQRHDKLGIKWVYPVIDESKEVGGLDQNNDVLEAKERMSLLIKR